MKQSSDAEGASLGAKQGASQESLSPEIQENLKAKLLENLGQEGVDKIMEIITKDEGKAYDRMKKASAPNALLKVPRFSSKEELSSLPPMNEIKIRYIVRELEEAKLDLDKGRLVARIFLDHFNGDREFGSVPSTPVLHASSSEVPSPVVSAGVALSPTGSVKSTSSGQNVEARPLTRFDHVRSGLSDR